MTNYTLRIRNSGKRVREFFSLHVTLNALRSFQNGFTLVELLVVIGVLGVLASGLVILINPIAQIQKANDARRKSDLEQIQRALEQYYNDNGSYPPSTGSPTYDIQNVSWGSPWVVNGQTYMSILPQDPTNSTTNKKYVYKTKNNNQIYYLYASLDRGANDPQTCNNGAGTLCPNAPGNRACGGVCNYGVSSPNDTP